MTVMIGNWIVESAPAPGVGSISLSGAITGCRSFVGAGFVTSSVVYFTMEGTSGGIAKRQSVKGTLTTGSPNTLSLDLVLDNTDGTAPTKINFDAPIVVYSYIPASKSIYIDANGEAAAEKFYATAAGVGRAKLTIADASNAGAVEFYKPDGTRAGYAGYTSSSRLLLGTEAGYTGWAVEDNLDIGGDASVGDDFTVGGDAAITGNASAATLTAGAGGSFANVPGATWKITGPGNILMQGGTDNTGGIGGRTITFATAFANTNITPFAGILGSASGDAPAFDTFATGSMVMHCPTAGAYTWMAVGQLP